MTDDPDLVDAKAQLRRRMRDVRRIERARTATASLSTGVPSPELQMAAHLDRARTLEAGQVVGGFMPIRDEFDPLEILRALDAGYELSLPQMTGADQPLTFRRWREGDPLVETTWGIREPAETCPIVTPNVLFVPLLAVDRAGYRLGYGGGFYDRTIAALRAADTPAATIGLAFDCLILDAVPRDAYDEPVDFILTPTGLAATHET